MRSRPGLGQISEVGDPSPGSGQTNGEGSALANGQNTNATNAPSHRSHGTSRRQLAGDFTSASGETTPKSDSSASGENTPQSSISPLKSGINEEESKAEPARAAATFVWDGQPDTPVQVWLTTGDQTKLLSRDADVLFSSL